MKISPDLVDALAQWSHNRKILAAAMLAELIERMDADMGAPTLKAQRSAPGEPEYHH